MGWKSSLAIHLGFWFYLVGGGAVYYYIENPMYHLPPTPKPMTINATFCQQFVNSVENYVATHGTVSLEHEDSDAWLVMVRDTCNNLTSSGKTEENANQDVAWEFSSALFLCMTILTTIGYGNFSPKSSWGKIFCIFYGFIGIPICGVFLASTSDYFSNSFLHLYEKRRHQLQKDKWHGIYIAAVVFLLPGLAVFLFVPSAIFVYLEDWSYLDATYFSFLTLTTIGFGDIVVAQETNYPQLWFYRVCWIIWVTLGIAYWAIIISFITKALKSKKLRQKWAKTSYTLSVQAQEMRRVVEHQLSTNGHNRNSFIALKSKAAFDFALQVTGSMGNVRDELKRHPLPGIATAFKPSGAGRGLLALMELSVKTLGHQREQHKQAINESAPVSVLAEDQVETSPKTEIYPRPTLINTQYCSMDSGFDDDENFNSKSTTPCHSRQLSKTNSDISPSYTTEENANKKNESKWKLLARRQTQPELQHRTSLTEDKPALRDLLMEAMLILEEAEDKETILSQAEAQ